MKFIKAETNGNDFIIFNKSDFREKIDITAIADRRKGIGADQVILHQELNGELIEVEFFNQDGSKASFCGNGLSALTQLLHRPKILYLIANKIYEGFCDLETGLVSIKTPLPVMISESFDYKIVDTGNKHLVTLSNTSGFLSRTDEFNVHFVWTIEEGVLKIETYERGAGRTRACGSGAIAAAFAYGDLLKKTKILHEGGISIVYFDFSSAYLITTPQIVFKGEFPVK